MEDDQSESEGEKEGGFFLAPNSVECRSVSAEEGGGEGCNQHVTMTD